MARWCPEFARVFYLHSYPRSGTASSLLSAIEPCHPFPPFLSACCPSPFAGQLHSRLSFEVVFPFCPRSAPSYSLKPLRVLFCWCLRLHVVEV